MLRNSLVPPEPLTMVQSGCVFAFYRYTDPERRYRLSIPQNTMDRCDGEQLRETPRVIKGIRIHVQRLLF